MNVCVCNLYAPIPATQVSPGERIDPEVEEVLLEIAEDFVDSVTNWSEILESQCPSLVLYPNRPRH
jgi:transcription initiation factor TFIID subunit TAF12